LLRKFSSPVYGQQVIGRGLRRIQPRNREVKERLLVVDHPKLEHGWLWKEIDAYVKENVGLQQEIDLDEPPDIEIQPDGSPDQLLAEDAADEGAEIILPEPDELEDKPLDVDWRDFLDELEYPMEKVTVTREVRTGESERDLTGTGFVTTISYSPDETSVPNGFIPPAEDIPVEQRKCELTDQVLELCRELLLENGLPPSGISGLYRAMLWHVSAKFLGGNTIGQCDSVGQLLFVQDSLHYLRRNLNNRPLLTAIIGSPPED
jgi:hypothetical protein